MERYEADWEQLQVLFQKLELAGEYWLCRGAVRCDLLGELKDWDDFDVVVEAPEDALHSAIERCDIDTSRTFHGGYSLRLSTGRKVDVWSLTSTRGRRCASLLEAVSEFEFNVDAIARSVCSGAVVDPLGVRSDIINRQLRLQGDRASNLANAYLPWKAAYLVLRHNFVPDASVTELWRKVPSFDRLPPKALSTLRVELRQLGIHRRIDAVLDGAQSYPGLADHARLLISYPDEGQ